MRLRARRSLTSPSDGPRRECVRHARSMSGIGVERHVPGKMECFCSLNDCVRESTTKQSRGPESTPTLDRLLFLGPFSSRFTLVRFQAWKVDGGVSVVSNGRVWSDRHGCYGSGSGSQGVEPRHVTSLAHPSNVERHRASGRWFETIQWLETIH